MVAVIAAVYLAAFVHSRRRVVAGVLFGFGAVLLIVCTVILDESWNRYTEQVGLPARYRITALLIVAATMAAGWFWYRRSVFVTAAVLLMSFALPWLRTWKHEANRYGGYYSSRTNLSAYLLVAAVTGFLAWWGVRERSRAVINYAVAMFAAVVMWFYFSDLMDKLGRSLGLIGLGLLGGWLLERLRRKLVRDMRAGTTTEVTA